LQKELFSNFFDEAHLEVSYEARYIEGDLGVIRGVGELL
jgi:hypothetical protein